MGSNFKDKFNSFMLHRNGPDKLSRDALILAIVLLVLSALLGDVLRSLFLTLGIAAMAYSYWRMFSSKTDKRRLENTAYLSKRSGIVNKIKTPLQSAAKQGQKAAEQAKDKEHRYFACPKCGQTVRVPKGVGKIRMTCPKCKEKFEKKA